VYCHFQDLENDLNRFFDINSQRFQCSPLLQKRQFVQASAAGRLARQTTPKKKGPMHLQYEFEGQEGQALEFQRNTKDSEDSGFWAEKVGFSESKETTEFKTSSQKEVPARGGYKRKPYRKRGAGGNN